MISSDFKITTFSLNKRKRTLNACDNCRKLHRKCISELGNSNCKRCVGASISCTWDSIDQISDGRSSNAKKAKLDVDADSEVFYEEMLKKGTTFNSQFVCATQPLAPLLSRDSFLCFEGKDFGLYFPWREVAGDSTTTDMNDDLRDYLTKRGAFTVPPIKDQIRLVNLYMEFVYPIYPVIERSCIDDLSSIPLLLLNSILLAGVRHDKSLDQKDIRSRATQFYERCVLLELAETQKITLIQSLLLMSIHEEGPDGATEAKKNITKACNLCEELALTNMGGSNGVANLPGKEGTRDFSFQKVTVGKKLLSRLFWISFCCDRLIAATSGRAMFYNVSDLIIDDLSINDFDEGSYQNSDFAIFTSWCVICKLLDRILCSLYRPPQNRVLDDNTLEVDILRWKMTAEINERYTRFLKLAHSYASILYFRSKVDLISLLVSKDQSPPSEEFFGSTYITHIHNFSDTITQCMESSDITQHVMVIHSILHVISLLQLERNAKSEFQQIDWATSSNRNFDSSLMKATTLLERFKDIWWFSGAAVRLCNVVLNRAENRSK